MGNVTINNYIAAIRAKSTTGASNAGLVKDGSGRPTATQAFTPPAYYIDAVHQNYMPTLPNPSTTMKLSTTAAIGHPDTIESERCDFKVWSLAIDKATVVESYDEWYQCYIDHTVDVELLDDDGNVLIDSFDAILIT